MQIPFSCSVPLPTTVRTVLLRKMCACLQSFARQTVLYLSLLADCRPSRQDHSKSLFRYDKLLTMGWLPTGPGRTDSQKGDLTGSTATEAGDPIFSSRTFSTSQKFPSQNRATGPGRVAHTHFTIASHIKISLFASLLLRSRKRKQQAYKNAIEAFYAVLTCIPLRMVEMATGKAELVWERDSYPDEMKTLFFSLFSERPVSFFVPHSRAM